MTNGSNTNFVLQCVAIIFLLSTGTCRAGGCCTANLVYRGRLLTQSTFWYGSWKGFTPTIKCWEECEQREDAVLAGCRKRQTEFSARCTFRVSASGALVLSYARCNSGSHCIQMSRMDVCERETKQCFVRIQLWDRVQLGQLWYIGSAMYYGLVTREVMSLILNLFLMAPERRGKNRLPSSHRATGNIRACEISRRHLHRGLRCDTRKWKNFQLLSLALQPIRWGFIECRLHSVHPTGINTEEQAILAEPNLTKI